MTRQGPARPGKARRGLARPGKARPGAAGRGKARRGAARRGVAGRGEARRGKARQGQNYDALLAPLTAGATMTDEKRRLRSRIAAEGGLRRLAVAISENAGYLSQVARGRRKACNRLRLKLGLQPRRVMADACPKCGQVHTSRRCTRRPTPDERAAQYDEWLNKVQARIMEIVEWASRSTKS